MRNLKTIVAGLVIPGVVTFATPVASLAADDAKKADESDHQQHVEHDRHATHHDHDRRATEQKKQEDARQSFLA